MTYEKAIQEIKDLQSFNCDECIEFDCKTKCYSHEALDMAIVALEKQDKYKWHDLRKNPYDLPKELEIVNITWSNHKPVPYYADIKDKLITDASAIYHNGKWRWWSVTCKDYLEEYGKSLADEMDKDIEVVAWKYIEPFEEVEE